MATQDLLVKISYEFISNLIPWIDNRYSIVEFFLNLFIFIFSSDLNIKNFHKIFKYFLSFSKKKNNELNIDLVNVAQSREEEII